MAHTGHFLSLVSARGVLALDLFYVDLLANHVLEGAKMNISPIQAARTVALARRACEVTGERPHSNDYYLLQYVSKLS